MKKIALILLIAAFAMSAEAQVRSTNVVYKFNTTLTGNVDTVRVTNTGTGSLVVKSWAGYAEVVTIHAPIKYVSGTITAFKGYVYPSNDGVNWAYTPIDSFLVKANSGTQAYVITSDGKKYGAAYYKLDLKGAGTGVATLLQPTILGKK